MGRHQSRLDTRSQLVPISLYPQTLEQLSEIQRISGESRGSVVRRLVEDEVDRLRRERLERAPVWVFPSYRGSGCRIPARVIYRSYGNPDRVFDADGDRLVPEPPKGGYVLIGEGPAQLRGQVESSELCEIDGEQVLVIAVRELIFPMTSDVPPVLFDYVQRLNADVAAQSDLPISFDPYRTTPSWKLGVAEVRAILISKPGERSRVVRFLPFFGPSFEEHLSPKSDFFPLVDIEDIKAQKLSAARIVDFLSRNAQDVTGEISGNAYSRWLEAVYILIHAELGGDSTQTGASRRFSDGYFGHGMEAKPPGDKGIVQFIVTIAAGPARGKRRASRYAWRDTPPSSAAYDAVRTYCTLIEGA